MSDESDDPTDTPAAPPAPPPWKRQLDESLGELKVMGNDIRQRLEKAGKSAGTEAKEAWKKLEPQLHTAEEKLVEVTDEAVDQVREQLKGLFGRLQGSLENLRDKLR